MIVPPNGYQRPELPSEDELVPSFQPMPPPTACESVIHFMHKYHRYYTTFMFASCILALIWGGLYGINMSSVNTTRI